jgi:AmiR/NasT family two-component response regulator
MHLTQAKAKTMTTRNSYKLMVGDDEEIERRVLADYDEEPLMEHCVRFGAFAYLTRPVQPTRLLSVLNRAIVVLDNTI